MQINRCGHFRVEAQSLSVSEAGITLRVPVRRCLLAERMIRHLATSEEGREIARKLSIASASGHLSPVPASSEISPLDDAVRAAFGPDLEAIHALECTVERCQESCTPGYQSFLRHFGFVALAEEETGVGCQPVALSEAEELAGAEVEY